MKKGEEKLVSIVVPVYNVEAYLKTCVDSLVRQTYPNIEILLINDGSEDGSGAICDEYAAADPRVRVIHKKNEGVSSARNDGIRMVKGEYVIFVDSDDFVHPQLVDFYMQNEDESCIVLCKFSSALSSVEKDTLSKLERGTICFSRQDFFKYIDYLYSPVNKLYRTKIIRDFSLQFQKEKSLGEDILFNLSYLRHAPETYKLIETPLYFYRENREGSLSSSYRPDLFAVQKETFREIRKFLETLDCWDLDMQEQYYRLFWDRLYLTARIYERYQRERKTEVELSEILRDAVWDEVWSRCKDLRQVDGKRMLKRLHICWMRRMK